MQRQPRTRTLALAALLASGVFLTGCDGVVSADPGAFPDAGPTEQVAGEPEASGVLDPSVPASPAAKVITPGDVEDDAIRVHKRFLSRY